MPVGLFFAKDEIQTSTIKNRIFNKRNSEGQLAVLFCKILELY